MNETLHRTDRLRIEEAAAFARAGDTGAVTAGLPVEFARHARFDHVGVLVFPRSLDELPAELAELGLVVGDPVPSVVVRDRLARRHGRPMGTLAIFRAPVGEREIEIFALAVPSGSGLDEIAAAERAAGSEAHVAFEVTAPDGIVLSGLRAALLDAGFRADGGGYNAHVDSTVLYFRADSRQRVELIAAGCHEEVLAAHGGWDEQPAKDLLRLMTGAWTTQAIGVAAELGLADRLAAGPMDVPGLARATGTDEDGLRRLLRYLATLGLFRRNGDVVELTALGSLLRSDVDHSLRPLAQMYATSFYEGFGGLGYSVRTGKEAFEHLFGSNHFRYFAQRPELADLFDRAMASSASMFGRVAELADLSRAQVVVDVAGGNGVLLSQVLRSAPHLRGVLFERAHAIEAGEATMAKEGCADRCDFIVGDFTAEIPRGGDVYLLSRVLHDWDDPQCLRILRRVAESTTPGTSLLIVERLLPEDDVPSLAVAWDLHMLVNVGGRERTAEHFGRLLAEAGFALEKTDELPLDAALLHAVRV